jgi:hypothetical protein
LSISAVSSLRIKALPSKILGAQIARLAAAASPESLRADIAFFPSAYDNSGSLTNLREDELDVGSLFRASFRNMAGN